MIDRGRVAARDGTEIVVHSGVRPMEALFLYSLARHIRPRVTIEIGYAMGFSGLAMLKALEDENQGIHHAIDPIQTPYWKGVGVMVAERAGLAHRLQLHEAYPEEIVPTLPRAQLAFIDGSHLFDLTLLDFVLVDKRLDVGGMIAFHDAWMPSIRKVLRYVVRNRAYERFHLDRLPSWDETTPAKHPLLRLPFARGAQRALVQRRLRRVVVLKKLDDDHREWRFHRRF